MHEMSLISDLMHKLDTVVRTEHAARVSRVRIKLGALAHISPDHFREHFEDAARGTASEGAVLEIATSTDERDPRAQDIVLESVEIEEELGEELEQAQEELGEELEQAQEELEEWQ